MRRRILPTVGMIASVMAGSLFFSRAMAQPPPDELPGTAQHQRHALRWHSPVQVRDLRQRRCFAVVERRHQHGWTRTPGLSHVGRESPLLAVHLLRQMAGRDGEGRIAERFAAELDGRKDVSNQRCAECPVRHQYALNVRELEQLLLLALYSSSGEEIELTSEVRDRLRLADRKSTPAGPIPEATPCDLVEKALDEHRVEHRGDGACPGLVPVPAQPEDEKVQPHQGALG